MILVYSVCDLYQIKDDLNKLFLTFVFLLQSCTVIHIRFLHRSGSTDSKVPLEGNPKYGSKPKQFSLIF